jgi:hypothetical protein
MKEFQEVPLSTIQGDILAGKLLYESHGKNYPISQLAPDLTVYDFHSNSFTYEELNISRVRGGEEGRKKEEERLRRGREGRRGRRRR